MWCHYRENKEVQPWVDTHRDSPRTWVITRLNCLIPSKRFLYIKIVQLVQNCISICCVVFTVPAPRPSDWGLSFTENKTVITAYVNPMLHLYPVFIYRTNEVDSLTDASKTDHWELPTTALDQSAPPLRNLPMTTCVPILWQIRVCYKPQQWDTSTELTFLFIGCDL